MKTVITVVVLAISGIVCYCCFDNFFVAWRVENSLPGDAKVLLEMISMFGHGVATAFAALLIWNLDPPRRKDIPVVIGATLLAGITATLLKVAVQRPRPFYISMVEVDPNGGIGEAVFNNALQSFPSGHTATAFALAGALTLLYPRGARMFFCFAILVGIQRVVTQNHFPSDVFAGAIIGIVDVSIVGYLVLFFNNKRNAYARSASGQQAGGIASQMAGE